MSEKRSSRVALASVALLVSGLAVAGLFMNNAKSNAVSNESDDFRIPPMAGVDPEYCYSKYPSMISRKLKPAYIRSHSGQRNVFALSRDKGTLMLTNKPGEKFVTLESPRLISQSGGPFELVFDVMFPTKTPGSVGRHGGIFWGARRKEAGRWNGHRTKQAGAETSVIDWIDRQSDHGIRIYGVRTPHTMNHYLRPLANPPSEWRILFLGDGKGTFIFFADGRKVATLEGVAFGANAYFGFYSYDRSDMVVSNVRIRSITSMCPKPLSMDEDEESELLDLTEDAPREE